MNTDTSPWSGHTDAPSGKDQLGISTDEVPYGRTQDASGCLNELSEVPIAGSPDQVASFALTSDDEVPTWDEATKRFRARLSADSPHTARFSSDWSKGTWARLLEVDEQLRPEVASTVLITLTGRTTFPGGSTFIPPCIHFARLKESQQAVRKALSRSLQAFDWTRVTVVHAHQSGYCHQHIGVYVNQPIESEQLKSVVTAHVDNSRIAEMESHDAGTVKVNCAPTKEEPTGLIGYLGCNVPGLDTRGSNPHGVLSEPEYRLRGASVLEAGGWQAVRLPGGI